MFSHQLTAQNFANMLNNSTQCLAAVATSISPLSDPRNNQFFCIHLCVLDVILGLVQLFELGTENWTSSWMSTFSHYQRRSDTCMELGVTYGQPDQCGDCSQNPICSSILVVQVPVAQHAIWPYTLLYSWVKKGSTIDGHGSGCRSNNCSNNVASIPDA